jgi:hypothetical protein
VLAVEALMAETVGGAALVAAMVGEVLLFFGDVGRLMNVEGVALSALGRERDSLLGVTIPLSASTLMSRRVFNLLGWRVWNKVKCM